MNNQDTDNIKVRIIKDKSLASIFYLVLSCLIFVAQLFLRSNALNLLSSIFLIILSIRLTVAILKRAEVKLLHIIAYIIFFIAIIMNVLIYGAGQFSARILGALVFISITALLSLLLIRSDRILLKLRIKGILIPLILSLLMVCSSIMYFINMNVRIRPNVESLMAGHDEYLRRVSSLTAGGNSPNVLVILMDDLGHADISSYSYLHSGDPAISTPNIDSIGMDGVFMDNFYSSSPVCSPSRFGILTGRYPARGYVDNVFFPTARSSKIIDFFRYYNSIFFKNNVDGILADEITIAEAVKAYGYDTALIGKWHLGDYGEYLPTNQGFDYFFGSYYSNDMNPYNIVRETDGNAEIVLTHNDNLDQSGITPLYTEQLIGFINNSIDSDNKFFAFYSSPWPHYPIFSGEKDNTADDNYIDCIEEFDTYLGDILTNLKDRGVYDDTLIIFTSDNGPWQEGATGALKGRKNTVYEGGHKVPMLVSYINGGLGAGISSEGGEPKRISTPAMNIDLFPTILEYLNIDILPDDRIIDGVSLYDLLQGNLEQNARIHNVLYYIKGAKVKAIQRPFEIDAIIYDFKYIDNVRTDNTAYLHLTYKNFLVNLSKDPIEAYNVANIYPAIAKDLREEMDAFEKQLKDNRRGKL